MPDSNLVTLLGGAFLLSFLHGLIPNHWVPFVLLGRERKWQTGRTVFVTFLGGTAHLCSTVFVGVLIGIAGYALSQRYERIVHWAAPAILLAVGVWIIWRGHPDHPPNEKETTPGSSPDHRAEESHRHPPGDDRFGGHDLATVGALCAMMFFSPCLELEAYYTVAAQQGWPGIIAVSVVYTIVAIAVMMTVVGFAARGLERVRWSFLSRHERKLSGGLLILLGLFWLLIPL